MPIQSALGIHDFHIHGFNQPRIENIKKKFHKFQKYIAFPLYFNYLHSVDTVLGIMHNLKMI